MRVFEELLSKMCIIVALCMQTTKKKLISYVLILPQAFFAVLDVRSPIEELLRGLRCVFLVCNLSTKKVAGLRWVRKGIGGIDLSGESLVQRSHNTGPVQIKKKTTTKATYSMSESQAGLVWLCGLDSLFGLFALRREPMAGSQLSPPGWSKKKKKRTRWRHLASK